MAEMGIQSPHQTAGFWEHRRLTLQNNFPFAILTSQRTELHCDSENVSEP